MKRLTIATLILIGLLAVAAYAQDSDDDTAIRGHYGDSNFIDEDGDGFCDNAPDADGDGIPNGQDPDYVKPEDGTGNMYRHQYRWAHANSEGDGEGEEVKTRAFGEGEAGLMDGEIFQYRYGPGFAGDGGPFGPMDGTGFGPGESSGNGEPSPVGDMVQSRQGRR